MNRSIGVSLVLLGGIALLAAATIIGGVGIHDTAREDTYHIRFTEVGAEQGFRYTSNDHRQFGSTRAGLYVSDVDRNGYPDVLAIGGDAPVLFENHGGEFARSQQLSEIDATIKTAVFFDQEGDGWEDLVLFRMEAPPIFLDNREGTFHRQDVGLNQTDLQIPVSATVEDYDRDGCLDLFVVQNGNWAEGTPKKEPRGTGGNVGDERPATVEIDDDNGHQNRLFEGDCATDTFTEVTRSVLPNATRWSLAASFVDFTGDGYPDIHVATDYNFDYLYVNKRGVKFEPVQITATNRNGMSSETVDVNGDGQMDVFVTNIHFTNGTGREFAKSRLPGINDRGNNLLVNDDGRLKPRADAYGVEWGGWGWAAAAVDFNNDGLTDLVHATKFLQTGARSSEPTPPSIWTQANGTFEKRNASQLGFDASNGRGLSQFDFDRDGDQDIAIAAIDGRFKLYENHAETGNWLQITVRSTDGAHAVGTHLSVTTPSKSYHLSANSKADFLSQDTRTHHVGLGAAETANLTVEFSDGTVRRFGAVGVNQRVTVYTNGSITAPESGSAAS